MTASVLKLDPNTKINKRQFEPFCVRIFFDNPLAGSGSDFGSGSGSASGSAPWDFGNGLCRVVKIATAEGSWGVGILTQQTICSSPQRPV